MRMVRTALSSMAQRGLDPWAADVDVPSPIVVDRAGAIFIRHEGRFIDVHGASLLDLPEDSLDLLGPFSVEASLTGRNLVRPRPNLRIVPTKVAGEPHVEHTRITSRSLAALVRRGIPASTVSRWYDIPESCWVRRGISSANSRAPDRRLPDHEDDDHAASARSRSELPADGPGCGLVVA